MVGVANVKERPPIADLISGIGVGADKLITSALKGISGF